MCTAQLLQDGLAVPCELCVLDMPATKLEHSPHSTWNVCSPARKLCCPAVTRSHGCQCLGEHIWGPLGCLFMVLCHISSITSCWESLLELMKIDLFIVSDSFLCFTGNAFILFSSLQLLNPGCLNVKKVAAVYQQALTQFLSKRNSPLTCSMFHDLFKRFPVSADGSVVFCWLQSMVIILGKVGGEASLLYCRLLKLL